MMAGSPGMADQLIITGTGFFGPSRAEVRQLAERLGATYDGCLTPKTTHLVVGGAPGAAPSSKVATAQAWDIPAVSLQWLLDSLQAHRLLPPAGYLVPCSNTHSSNQPAAVMASGTALGSSGRQVPDTDSTAGFLLAQHAAQVTCHQTGRVPLAYAARHRLFDESWQGVERARGSQPRAWTDLDAISATTHDDRSLAGVTSQAGSQAPTRIAVPNRPPEKMPVMGTTLPAPPEERPQTSPTSPTLFLQLGSLAVGSCSRSSRCSANSIRLADTSVTPRVPSALSSQSCPPSSGASAAVRGRRSKAGLHVICSSPDASSTAASACSQGQAASGSTASTAVRVAVQQPLPEGPPGSTVASRHKLAGPDCVRYYQMLEVITAFGECLTFNLQDATHGALVHYDDDSAGQHLESYAALVSCYQVPGSEEVWIEHTYLDDRDDLKSRTHGTRFLQRHAVESDELVASKLLYHSPASVIEGEFWMFKTKAALHQAQQEAANASRVMCFCCKTWDSSTGQLVRA